MNSRFHFHLVLMSLFLGTGAIGKSAGPKQDAVPAPTASPTGTASTTSSAGSEASAGSPTPAEDRPKILRRSIEAPFGLRWGESKEEVQTQLAKAGAKITKGSKAGDREVLAVEGITQLPSLQQTLAYFDATKALVEVELQYGDSTWTFDAYRAFVVSVTRRLQAYYGEPTVLARDRRSKGDGIQTVAGYQWQVADSSGVILFFFSVEQGKGKNVYTTVSVHYRAVLPEAPPSPSPTPEESPAPDASAKTH
jgi:hypothetical protein